MASTAADARSPATDIHADRILILDFGSQYTQLIARRVRELKVYSEIRAYDMSDEDIRAFAPRGIILSGGPESVHESRHVRAPEGVFELGVPVLGICYGMQTMAEQLGGAVEPSSHREFGYARVQAHGHSALLDDIQDETGPKGEGLLDVWMSHGDRVGRLPAGFACIASTDNAPIAGIADEARDFYGLQFHPEVTHTRQGKAILERFVDSSVVAALLHEAVADRLTCIFVDTGLLRLDEGDQVMQTFHDHLGVNVVRVDAEPRFLGALEGVEDPEAKRKIIGRLFIEIFEEESHKLQGVRFLAQGTIYPDVIESAGAATGKAHVIKSHHNVGGLPERMNMELVEPLRELFKDEVRTIGVELGLPREMVYRHPFPGPGLGVRILGRVEKRYADVLRQADAIFIEELRAANLYDQVSQAFAVYLPVNSVGVMGDARRYEHVVALRAVETIDFMTARWAHLPFEFLERCSSRIINEVPGISRVVYDISGKPPATIEWE